jgi:hypothetical protein
MSQKEVKFLDLDAFAPKEVFKIKLNGQVHEMKQMTVEDFAWASKEAEVRADAEDPMTMVATMVEVLGRQFPTMSEEDFKGMSFEKLAAILDFTRQVAEEGSEAALKEAAAEGKVTMTETETEETPQQ